jgi:hypothetical protein
LIFNQEEYFLIIDCQKLKTHFMENTARDYSKELSEARGSLPVANQLQNPGQFNVPKNGSADNYNAPQSSDNYSQPNAGGNNSQGSDNEGSDHGERLADARKDGKSSVKEKLDAVKNMAKTATPMGALSLMKQVNPATDLPYVAAMGAALAKDLVTMVTFVTVILPIIFSILCSIFIFMMLMLVGANGKRSGANSLLKKVGWLLGGGVLASIPGLDIFPFETATVAVIYYLTLVERKGE